VCPLCLCAYLEGAVDSGELTLEHVPPKKLGGRGLLLTCRVCNSRSGHTLDAALVQREQVQQFEDIILRNLPDATSRAKWEAEGETLNVEIYRVGKFVRIAGLPKLNDPKVVQRLVDRKPLDGRVTSLAKYHKLNADIGDLRTAYLAAFCLLGYRYALQPALNRIREQIANPDTRILAPWSNTANSEIPPQRIIFEVKEPHCLLAQIDRTLVLLPIPGRTDNLYDEIASRRERGENQRFTGDYRLGWPARMELREDESDNSPLPRLTFHAEEIPDTRNM
jgi:hypothetical protein